MILGTLVLGGTQRAQLLPIPRNEDRGVDGGLGAVNCGLWYVESDLPKHVIHIPSRSKSIDAFTPSQHIVEALKVLDSSEGPDYRTKLLQAMDRVDDPTSMIVNHNESTHSSLAIVAGDPLYLYGLVDTQRDQQHLLWTSDPMVFASLRQTHPLRFQVYRFPVLTNSCVFLQVETVCAKWWRWMKNGTHLRAFNALEHRLFGSNYYEDQ